MRYFVSTFVYGHWSQIPKKKYLKDFRLSTCLVSTQHKLGLTPNFGPLSEISRTSHALFVTSYFSIFRYSLDSKVAGAAEATRAADDSRRPASANHRHRVLASEQVRVVASAIEVMNIIIGGGSYWAAPILGPPTFWPAKRYLIMLYFTVLPRSAFVLHAIYCGTACICAESYIFFFNPQKTVAT